jgi:hypothetical protein
MTKKKFSWWTMLLVVLVICLLVLLTPIESFSPPVRLMRSADATQRQLQDNHGSSDVSDERWQELVEHEDALKIEDEDDEVFTLPWTEFQEWALRDNILKYVISVPRKGDATPEIYALWRTISREVVELSGYPVEMLQKKHSELIKMEPSTLRNTPKALPLIDAYEFESSGGLSGQVYGIPGVAEGSRIETAGLRDLQHTLSKGYVITEDSSVVYELGTPLRDFYSLDGENKPWPKTLGDAKQNMRVFASDAISRPADAQAADEWLLRLGTSTAILLAGATAVNVLSHHLTINVFWV